MTKVTVISGTAKLNVPEQIDKCKHIYELMLNNSRFPNPPADLKVFLQEIESLEKASSSAKSGGKKDTADLHRKLAQLLNTVDLLRAYVQNVANKNLEEAEVIVNSAGMSVKNLPNRVRFAFAASRGENSGEIVVSSIYERSMVYVFQMTTTPDLETSWIEIWHSTKSRKHVTGLVSGTRYYFRMCNVLNNMLGPWSEVVNCIAP